MLYLIGMSVPFLCLSYFLFSLNFTKGFAISLAVAYIDMWIALTGLKKALAYSKEPHTGLWVFHKYTFFRVVNIGVMFYALSLVIRLKDYAGGLCIGFLLMHILLFFYILVITRFKGSVEKGE
ncbi:MAG: hypothetical protein MJ032_02580 [Acidaminococcaceae bacterium]|nr:hypothetical protein [Acidaminococcaceae bacterium]